MTTISIHHVGLRRAIDWLWGFQKVCIIVGREKVLLVVCEAWNARVVVQSALSKVMFPRACERFNGRCALEIWGQRIATVFRETLA